MKKYSVILLISMVLSSLCGVETAAQDTTIKTKKDAELLIPRLSTQPVKSIDPSIAQGIDTLDTANPHIKIVLMSDYTWKYFKDKSYAVDKAVFNEYWTHDSPNPYGVQLDSLPSETAFWVVDTLSGYHCPHQTKVYSKFGVRHGRRHQGADLPLDTGTPVYAAFDGKVRIAHRFRGYGNLVVVRHDNGLETFYAHLSKIYVMEDEWVNAGTIIGLGGSTGRSTGPHLHFETRYKGYAFDPEWLIDFQTGTLRHRLFVLKRKYLSPASNYVPEDEQEEIDIIEGDTRAEEEAKAKAEAERKAREAAQYHTIRQGDTLGRLAVKYHTTVRAICRLNPGLKETTILQLGRKIRVK